MNDQVIESLADDGNKRKMAPIYVAVMIVEFAMLIGLWIFSQYFGS